MLLEHQQAGEVIQESPVPRSFTAFSECSSMAGFPNVGAGVEETPKNLTVSNSVFPTLWFMRNKPWLEHNSAEVSAVNRLRCCIHVLMDEAAAPGFQENTAPPQLPAKGRAADQTALFA